MCVGVKVAAYRRDRGGSNVAPRQPPFVAVVQPPQRVAMRWRGAAVFDIVGRVARPPLARSIHGHRLRRVRGRSAADGQWRIALRANHLSLLARRVSAINNVSSAQQVSYRAQLPIAHCSLLSVFLLLLCVSAWLLYPVLWFPWFGKLLFSACDCVLGALLHRLLSLRDVPSSLSLLCVCVLLFNPLSLTVSTRGNGDVLHILILYAMLLSLCTHRGPLAAVCFGVAVHLRLYPIVYLPSLLLALDDYYCLSPCQCGLRGPASLGRPLTALRTALSTAVRSLQLPMSCVPSVAAMRHRMMFGVLSASTFIALFAVCALLYGRPFVAESVLHHVGRLDTRHNFSLLFYPLYLSHQHHSHHHHYYSQHYMPPASLLSFAPQLLLSLLCSARLSSDLPLCLLIQTLLFVAFNKVVTAQYFLWYVSLLPLVLPFTRLSTATLCALSVVWLVAELHWLSWAYQVELLGIPAFAGLHIASCCFFTVCIICTAVVVRGHCSLPLFLDGRLTSYQYGHSKKQQTVNSGFG